MSTSWPDELRTAWGMLREHPAQAREYRTRPLTGEFPLDAYAALRAADDAPCLLIRSEAPPGSLFEVGGMRLSVDRDERGTLLLLSLEDTARSDLFTTVCADALAAAGNDAEEALDLFLVRLDAWRRFLRERHAGLSREDTVGLIGELVMLERLLSSRPDFLASWKAPEDGLHDFEAAVTHLRSRRVLVRLHNCASRRSISSKRLASGALISSMSASLKIHPDAAWPILSKPSNCCCRMKHHDACSPTRFYAAV